MKILGHTKLKQRVKKVTIGEAESGEPITVTLHAPRLSFINGLDDILPEPPVPEAPSTGKVMRDDRGRIVKDDKDRPIVEQNYDDPNYKKRLLAHASACSAVERAQSMAILLECCDPKEIALDLARDEFTDGNGGPGKKGSLVDYYTAAWAEFEAANVDVIALAKLTQAAGTLSDVGDEEVADARAALVGGGEGN